MYRSVELNVGGKLLRGVVRAPKAEGIPYDKGMR